MTNITFNVDDEIHKKMREHPEIKWTEILRQSIKNYLKKVAETDVISITDFRNRLDTELIEDIMELDEQEELKSYSMVKKMEEERLNHLQDLERSTDAM